MTKQSVILVTILGGVLWVVALLFLGLWILTEDLPSAEDDDLRVTRETLPGDQNAFRLIQDAAHNLKWPKEQDEQLRGGNREAMMEVLTQNQEALTLLDQGLAIGRLQVPEETPGSELSIDPRSWMRLGRLIGFRVRLNVDTGRTSGAFDDAFDLLRFGHMVEGAQGGMFVYLLGNNLKSQGLAELRELLSQENLSSEFLQPIVESLELLRPQEQSFLETLQQEYTYMATVIEKPSQIGSDGDDETNDLEKLEHLLKVPLFRRYLYQENATKKLLADRYREMAESWDKNCTGVDFCDPGSERANLVQTIWKPNFIGRTLVQIGVPGTGNTLLSKCRLQTDFSATQLLVALMTFRADRGDDPPSIDSLVPDYVPVVPLDDYDGRPLRYLREDELIYSVGANLVDDGGDPQKDMTFPFSPHRQ